MDERINLDSLAPGYWSPGDPERYQAVIDELRAARQVVDAAPAVEHCRELVRWLDLIDLLASKVDPDYTLPRDEIQRDLKAFTRALTKYRGISG